MLQSGKQDPFQPIAGQLSESVVPSHFTEVPDTDREGRGFVRTRDRANWLGRFPKKVTVPTARTSFPSPPLLILLGVAIVKLPVQSFCWEVEITD